VTSPPEQRGYRAWHNISTETTARELADFNLGTNISTEI